MSSGDNVDISEISPSYNPSNGDVKQMKEKSTIKVYKKTTSASNPFLKQARYRRSTASASDTSSTDDLSPTACDPPMITNRFIGRPRHVTPYRAENETSNGNYGHQIYVRQINNRKKETISPYSGNSESNTNSLSPSRHSSFSSFSTTSTDNAENKLSGHTLNSPVSDKSGYSPSSEGFNDDWKDNLTATSVTPCQVDEALALETDSNHTLSNDLSESHHYSNGYTDPEPSITVNGNSIDSMNGSSYLIEDTLVNGGQEVVENGQHHDHPNGNYHDLGNHRDEKHDVIENDSHGIDSDDEYENKTIVEAETMETIVDLNGDQNHQDNPAPDQLIGIIQDPAEIVETQRQDQELNQQTAIEDQQENMNRDSLLSSISHGEDMISKGDHDESNAENYPSTIIDQVEETTKNDDNSTEVHVEASEGDNSSVVKVDVSSDAIFTDRNSSPLLQDLNKEFDPLTKIDRPNSLTATEDITPVSDLISYRYHPTESILQQIYDLEQKIMDVAVEEEQELLPNEQDDSDMQNSTAPESMNEALLQINKLNQQNRELRRRNNALVGHIKNRNDQLHLIRRENLLLLAERKKMIGRSSNVGIDIHLALERTAEASQLKYTKDEINRMNDEGIFQDHAHKNRCLESAEASNVDKLINRSFSNEQILMYQDNELLKKDSKIDQKSNTDRVVPNSVESFDHKSIVSSAMNSYGLEDLKLDNNNWRTAIDVSRTVNSLESHNQDDVGKPIKFHEDNRLHSNQIMGSKSSFHRYYTDSSKFMQSSIGNSSTTSVSSNIFDTSSNIDEKYFKALANDNLSYTSSKRDERIKLAEDKDILLPKSSNIGKFTDDDEFNIDLSGSLHRTDYSTYESPRYRDRSSYSSPRSLKVGEITSSANTDCPRGWPSSPMNEGEIRVGSVVRINSVTTRKSVVGTVKYKGSIGGKAGVHFGILLDTQDGNSDGKHDGKRYFYCKSGYGIFVPFGKIVMVFK
ncbi:hypothetical protein TrispH2_003710 [Trichoplax sp. H2]|nr:hypothetical protein TrispH2_003710 [Trichoplax sp. H2]|eukprot:RDD44568.1 hypothetical protein TrispH2_003710 [Trichoplax sp. H2]